MRLVPAREITPGLLQLFGITAGGEGFGEQAERSAISVQHRQLVAGGGVEKTHTLLDRHVGFEGLGFQNREATHGRVLARFGIGGGHANNAGITSLGRESDHAARGAKGVLSAKARQ